LAGTPSTTPPCCAALAPIASSMPTGQTATLRRRSPVSKRATSAVEPPSKLVLFMEPLRMQMPTRHSSGVEDCRIGNLSTVKSFSGLGRSWFCAELPDGAGDLEPRALESLKDFHGGFHGSCHDPPSAQAHCTRCKTS